MRKRACTDECEVRMLNVLQACAYTGRGQTQFKKWAKQIGATRKFGRSVRYDKKVIDKALDDLCAGNSGIVVGFEMDGTR